MIEKYRDINRFGAYDVPKTMTFRRAGWKLSFYGEGGNQHIKIDENGGSVDLWVDYHTGDCHPFIHRPHIVGTPSATLAMFILENLNRLCNRDDGLFFHFDDAGVDTLVFRIYQEMLYKSGLRERANKFGFDRHI